MNINTFVKLIQQSLQKLAKTIHIQPKLLFIILGLLLVIFTALGLGTSYEGFSSIADANESQTKAINDMLSAIHSAKWLTLGDKTSFITLVNTFYATKMKFLTQGNTDINKYDIGRPADPNKPDNLVYVSNHFPRPVFDASNAALPIYVDNIAANRIDLTKYTLNTTVPNAVNQSDLDTLTITLNTAIDKLTRSDQIALKTAFSALSKNANDIYAFTTNPKYNPNSVGNILDQGTHRDGSYWDRKEEEQRMEINRRQGNYDISTGAYLKNNKRSSNGGYDVSVWSSWGGYGNSVGSSSTGSASSPSPTSVSGSSISNSPWGDAGAGSNTGSGPDFSPNSVGTTSANNGSASANNGSASANNGSTSANNGSSRTSGSGNANPSPAQNCGNKPAPVPPCPPCERCPEPAFDCKKVPNYNSASVNQYLPQPILTDFSQFGM